MAYPALQMRIVQTLSNYVTQMIAFYGVFAAGFATRPLGALVFGIISDRYSRKTALMLSIGASGGGGGAQGGARGRAVQGRVSLCSLYRERSGLHMRPAKHACDAKLILHTVNALPCCNLV